MLSYFYAVNFDVVFAISLSCLVLSPWQMHEKLVRETHTKNSHEKLSRNRTRSIWCEKLAREISCCKSVWHTYKFLARISCTCVMGFRLRCPLLVYMCWTESVTVVDSLIAAAKKFRSPRDRFKKHPRRKSIGVPCEWSWNTSEVSSHSVNQNVFI